MAEKPTNKEKNVEHSVRMIELLDFVNETERGIVPGEELNKRFDPLLISNMITRGFLESNNKGIGLTNNGFNFLIQLKINKNIDKLNACVIKLNSSSDELNLLTVVLIVLTMMLIVKEFAISPLVSLISSILLFLALLAINYMLKQENKKD